MELKELEQKVQSIKDEMKDFYKIDTTDEQIKGFIQIQHYDRIEEDSDYDGEFVFDTGEREDFYLYLK